MPKQIGNSQHSNPSFFKEMQTWLKQKLHEFIPSAPPHPQDMQSLGETRDVVIHENTVYIEEGEPVYGDPGIIVEGEPIPEHMDDVSNNPLVWTLKEPHSHVNWRKFGAIALVGVIGAAVLLTCGRSQKIRGMFAALRKGDTPSPTGGFGLDGGGFQTPPPGSVDVIPASVLDARPSILLPKAPPLAARSSGIEMSNVSLNGKGNVIRVKPGETIQMNGDYRVLAGRNSGSHLVVGLDKGGAKASTLLDQSGFRGLDARHDLSRRSPEEVQTYIATAPGGPLKKAGFTFQAPTKPGVYKVQFRYAENLQWDPIRGFKDTEKWWTRDGAPGVDAIVGYIVVE